MKRYAVLPLFSLLCLTGCGPREIAVHSLFHECGRPALSATPMLDETEHLGSVKNVAALLESLDARTMELEAFSSALACYEAQTATGRGGE